MAIIACLLSLFPFIYVCFQNEFNDWIVVLQFQSLLRLKEPAVLLRCREIDRELVESILGEAKQEYAEKADVHPPEITVDERVYLPPPPTNYEDHSLFW